MAAQHPHEGRPGNPEFRRGRRPITLLGAPLIRLFRYGLVLTWFLLIVTSHDEPQSKAVQLIACLMEMLSTSSRQEWTG